MKVLRNFAFLLVIGWALLWNVSGSAFSPFWPPPSLDSCNTHYCGVGDIITLDAFYSCTFAYSRAYAQPGTNRACLLYKHLDGTGVSEPGNNISQCTLLLKPDGTPDLDTTAGCPATDGGPNQTVNVWGQYRSRCCITGPVGTASASSGDLNVTALTSGVVEPDMQVNSTSAWIVKQTSGTPGGVGHYQLSSAISFGSQAFSGSRPFIKVGVYYDQTGNGYDATARNDGVVGTILLRFGWGSDGICLGSLPCVTDAGMSTTPYAQAAAASSIPNVAPEGITAVGARRSGQNATQTRTVFVACSAMTSQTSTNETILVTTAGTWQLGGVAGLSETIDTMHSSVGYIQRLDGIGGTAILNVDGTENTGTLSSGALTAPVVLENQPHSNGGWPAKASFDFGEGGCKKGNAAFATSATRAAIIANERKRYGTP